VSDRVYWLTWVIFALTYCGLALGKIPGLRIDRAGIAFVGAVLILITGILSLADATSSESIDFKTLFLLLGMMIVVGSLRLSGVFQRLTDLAAGSLASPRACWP
jgi:Na+/H+ antiporter NhaD/arsenite permease-like protein